MKYLSVVAGLLLVAVIHEFGHAVAMYKSRVEIKEFAIGLPIIPLGIKKRIWELRFLGVYLYNLDLRIWPFFLIGAYVMPTNYGQQKLEKLPQIERMKIWWAGPFANLFSGLIYLSFYSLFEGLLDFVRIFAFLLFGFLIALPFLFKRSSINKRSIQSGVIKLFLVTLSLGTLCLIAATFQLSETMGPVGLVAEMPEMASSFTLQFLSLSLAIAIFNLLPVPPLDGGKIIIDFLEGFGMSKKTSRKIVIASSILLFVGIVAITINDVSRLLK